jgi:hypothetical protein
LKIVQFWELFINGCKKCNIDVNSIESRRKHQQAIEYLNQLKKASTIRFWGVLRRKHQQAIEYLNQLKKASTIRFWGFLVWLSRIIKNFQVVLVAIRFFVKTYNQPSRKNQRNLLYERLRQEIKRNITNLVSKDYIIIDKEHGVIKI